ncbi:EF-P beta-lysylation protein EpmB [Umboniibacter marinipuniceus]|uniref:L-lysine 2,3-aminomutase n=1 Tax=Umboniibacter marinipuniceus TaxID=569599 RepID=A0A3M0ACQ6_9GAMM|nr:EF-P beta-lysylation protein EpmB [Umboniibacter marinipuniceus]RMA82326.1 L-lysine 2,3-aminomutase [Umboniibacter marinipuniceus]
MTLIYRESQSLSWQQQLQQAFTCRTTLLAAVDVADNRFNDEAINFPLLVPQAYANRIRKGDPKDPLLAQILTVGDELIEHPDYSSDPLAEAEFTVAPGIIHKYRSRILLVLSGKCAVNCRYCFRRHFPYEDNRLSTAQWQSSLSYLSDHPEVNEVILSGGDPLMLNDKSLQSLIRAIEAYPQIKRLRIHTRLPLVIPARVTNELCQLLQNTRLNAQLVWHINHPNEIDEEVAEAALKLHRSGVRQFNQSVLLAGVNNCSTTLAVLSEKLDDLNIQPYYLHLLDRVQGAAHFQLSADDINRIYQQLCALLPGTLTPKLSREEAGGSAKTVFGNGL